MKEQKPFKVLVKDMDSHHGVEFKIKEKGVPSVDAKIYRAIEQIKLQRKEANMFEVRITACNGGHEDYQLVSP